MSPKEKKRRLCGEAFGARNSYGCGARVRLFFPVFESPEAQLGVRRRRAGSACVTGGISHAMVFVLVEPGAGAWPRQ